MRYKPSRRLHLFFLLSTVGHVAFVVWGLPWLATLPPGRPHATPVRIAVVTPDTTSHARQAEVDANSVRSQPVVPPAAVPSPAPAPIPQEVIKVRPQPPQPPHVAKVKSPVAQASPARRHARAEQPRPRKVRKRPTPRSTEQKRQPAAPPSSPSPPPSQPAASSAPAVVEAPIKAQNPLAVSDKVVGAERTESPARRHGKSAAVVSPPPPRGWVPRFAYKPCPQYPYVARRRRVEGTVTLRFAVLPAGTIGAIQVVKSSGNTLLDKAAQKAVRQWRPLPHKGLGRDNTWVHVPFTFALTAQSGSNGHNASGGPSGRVAVNCDAGAKR